MGGAVWCDSYTISDVWESTAGWNQRKEIREQQTVLYALSLSTKTTNLKTLTGDTYRVYQLRVSVSFHFEPNYYFILKHWVP